MRKIYSIMLALFATLCVGTAYAEDPITLTINVDNPNAIELTMTEGYGQKTLPLVAGNNVISVPYNTEYSGYEILRASAKSGFLVDSLTASPATAPRWADYSMWGGGYELNPTTECNNVVYSFHTTNLNDLRNDSVIFIIDKPSDVQVMYYGSGTINITKDTTVVYYCGDETVEALQDLPLTVQPTYGKLIYKVFHNDTELKEIQSWNGSYYAVETPENGDTIRVLTEAPAGVTAPAIIKLDSVAKEALDSVIVNGAKVELKDTIIVPWGKTIELAFNIDDYKVTVNNSPLNNYSNPYSVVVTDTTEIEVTAVKYVKYEVKLILHDHTCFKNFYLDDYFTVNKDTTILLMSAKSSRLSLYVQDGCLIDSVKWNGKTQYGTTIYCEEAGVIEAWAHKVVREQKFMLYVQRDSMSSMTMMSKLYYYFCGYSNPLQADYTECAFSVKEDNPIQASFSTKSGKKAVCYLNDSILTPDMWGSIKANLADSDIFRVYADTAEVYTVSFALTEGAEISDVKKDHITAIDASKEYSVLEGTEITFKTAATVTVDGKQLMAYKGVYTVPVVANTVITLGEPLSIANTVETPYTIEDAIMLTDAGVALTDTVFVIGIVDRIGITATNIAKYGNVDVYLTDGELTYEFYRMLNVGGAKFADSAAVSATFAVGDTLIAKGTLTYYAKNDMYELNQKCQLVEVRKLVVPSIANTAENPYTIAEAIELTKAGVALDDTVYVIGVVDHIGTTDANIIKYGNIDVYLKQDTLEYEFYRMLNIGGVKFDSTFIAEPTFVAGDTLIAKGTLTYYASKNMYELNEKCQLVEVRKAAVEPEPEIAQYQLHGSWVENWGGPKLEIAEDKATATATVEMNAGNYGFGIKQIDAAGAQIAWLWTANTEGDTFTREAKAFVFVNQKEVSGKNPTLAADVDGVYTFVWTYADNTLTITFPAKPEGIFNTTVDGQAEKFVRDGQLIIRMNGVEYNVLGAKIQ